MSEQPSNVELAQASENFRQAHLQAILQDWRAGISGRKADLFSYEEVRKILEAREGAAFTTAQDVPLDKIVGSVGRYQDFTQAFLPRNAALRNRWQRVDAAMSGLAGVPSVELYQVGDLYFVLDGNHRVSVARSRGDEFIEAYVTPVDAPIPIEADSAEALSAWLLEAGYRLFLDRTHLLERYADADVRLTEAGRYRQLREQIDVHRWYLGENLEREVSYEEAVESWYENVYLPLAEAIQESGVLREFPNRTVADLYLWICYHREDLKEQFNLDLDEKAAVSTFASVHSDRRWSKAIKGARLALARIAAGEDVIIGLPKENQVQETM